MSDKEIFDDLDDDFDDPYYVAPTEEEEAFAEDIFNFLQAEIDKSDILEEEFTGYESLKKHFKQHCIGKSSSGKSKYNSVKYDFKDISQYKEYEKVLIANIKRFGDDVISFASLLETQEVINGFWKLFEGGKYLLFSKLCGFKNNQGPVILVLHSFANNATENFTEENTIDLMILTPGYKTITLYPVAASYLENKFNNIIKQHTDLDISFNINR